jgi:hypothetical protein
MIAVHLQTKALDELQVKAAQIGKSGEVSMVGARGVGNLVREHLFALDNSGANQLGGVRTHFFASAAKSVEEPRPEGQGASFLITKIGLALRWLGGTVKAGKGISSKSGKLTKYLAIPARAESYGKTPAEFDDLVFVPRGNGKAMLMQALQTSIDRKAQRRKGATVSSYARSAGGLVMFWLVTQVTQQPDPNVMPSEEAMATAAAGHMENYLARLLESGGPSTLNPQPSTA